MALIARMRQGADIGTEIRLGYATDTSQKGRGTAIGTSAAKTDHRKKRLGSLPGTTGLRQGEMGQFGVPWKLG
jgi:hypothetical protein